MHPLPPAAPSLSLLGATPLVPRHDSTRPRDVDKILINAIDAAISSPNHKVTELWQFIKLGSETIWKIAFLNASEIAKTDAEKAQKKIARWENIPGWCVVICAKSSDKLQFLEEYAATSCAIHNFHFSMWADGVGVKWTTGMVTKMNLLNYVG